MREETLKMSQYDKYDVVQLNPPAVDNTSLASCFLVITNVYSWGVTGYIPIPGREIIHYRADWDEISKPLGKAIYKYFEEE